MDAGTVKGSIDAGAKTKGLNKNLLRGWTPSPVARKLAATKARLQRFKDSPFEKLNSPEKRAQY